MHQHQPPQKLELPNRKIGIVRRLSSFFSKDAHPHISFSNHGHIVGPVSDGQARCSRDRVHFHEIHHLLFLDRGQPTRDDGPTGLPDFQQLCALGGVGGLEVLERGSVHDQRHLRPQIAVLREKAGEAKQSNATRGSVFERRGQWAC